MNVRPIQGHLRLLRESTAAVYELVCDDGAVFEISIGCVMDRVDIKGYLNPLNDEPVVMPQATIVVASKRIGQRVSKTIPTPGPGSGGVIS